MAQLPLKPWGVRAPATVIDTGPPRSHRKDTVVGHAPVEVDDALDRRIGIDLFAQARLRC